MEQVYPDGMPKEIKSIRVKLNSEGTEKFRVATKNNINERFGIIVNDVLVSAPMAQTEIPNGEISITARLTNKEVKSIIKGLKI